MPRTLLKPRLLSNKHKPKIKHELKNTKSNLPPNLRTSEQKILSGNGFIMYKWAQKNFKY